MTNCRSDFLTFWEPCQFVIRWNIGNAIGKVSHLCCVISSFGFQVSRCRAGQTEFSAFGRKGILPRSVQFLSRFGEWLPNHETLLLFSIPALFFSAHSVVALHLCALKSLRMLFNSLFRLLLSSTPRQPTFPADFTQRLLAVRQAHHRLSPATNDFFSCSELDITKT